VSDLDNILQRFNISPETLKENDRVEKEREYKEKQREAEEAKKSRDMILANFPARFKDSAFDNYLFDVDEEFSKKQRHLIHVLLEGKSLVMFGNNGTGKTRLAFASMRDKVLKGESVYYMTASEFFDEVKMTFNNTIKVSDVLENYLGYDHLFIDEVDKSYGTITEFIALFRLVDKRYLQLKQTVLMANADDDKDSDKYVIKVIGRSTYERIVEDGTAIYMNWKSFRARRKVKDETLRII